MQNENGKMFAQIIKGNLHEFVFLSLNLWNLHQQLRECLSLMEMTAQLLCDLMNFISAFLEYFEFFLVRICGCTFN